MSHTHYIYRVTNRLDGRVYVGVSKDPDRRWRHHQTYRKYAIGEAIRQCGFWNFTFQVIACCRTLDDALATERALIAQHRSNDPAYGYNIASGGQGRNAIAPSTRALLSAQRMGNTRARATKVAQYTLDGTLVAVHRSVKMASEVTGVHRTHIQRTIRHRPTDTAGGFRWATAK